MQELYYQGQYKQILAATTDSAQGAFEMADLPYILGALTFRGRLTEAGTLFKIHHAALTEDGLVMARFVLGVGHARHSNYGQARAFLAANLRGAARSESRRARFFAWQGLGFYRLLCGRHKDGFRAAQHALEAAIEANFLYGKALASDLMAHNQVLPGQVSAALGSFRDAIRYATLLGDGGLLQAIQVSLAIHSAQYGLAPATDLAELVALQTKIASQDNYSKSRLLLEIARQRTLRGDADAARTALNEACQLIYGSNNRRYSIVLNLRYATLMFLSGEQHQALNLVRNAAKELDPEVDRALAVEIMGLERKIQRAMGIAEGSALNLCLSKLSAETGRVVAHRILAREESGDTALLRFGDDPLGDLLDLAQRRGHDAAHAIIDKGFYGLILHLIPASAGKRVLYFDLIPGSMVIADRGSVRYCFNGFSSVIRAIARALGTGEASKQDLIEKVWGYKYQTLKHDPLIYRNVSRFRALLGAASGWLEVTESGYRFAAGVEVRFHEREETKHQPLPDSLPQDPADSGLPAPEGVNFRQLQILERLGAEPFVDVRALTGLLQVSEMTARRDLTHLHKLHLVTRTGKGRATRYSLARS